MCDIENQPQSTEQDFIKPRCGLTGTNGNALALASKVCIALKEAGYHDKVVEFKEKFYKCKSYDHALQLMMEYVDVY